MALSVQQQRLSIDTINFQDVSVSTRSTSVVQSSVYDTILSGVTTLSGATVLGLGTYSMDVTAGNVGAGAGQCVASADSAGNVLLRRIKAGTDVAVTSDSTTVLVNLAPTISRTNTTINGTLSTDTSSINTVSNCANASFSGEITLNTTFSPALSPNTIWTPLNKGDLMTFDDNGNVITHISTGQADGNVLTVDNASPTGLRWISSPSSTLNLETALPLTQANRIAYITDNTAFAGTPIPTAYASILTAGNARQPINFLQYNFVGAAGTRVSWADPRSAPGTTFNFSTTSLTYPSYCTVTGSLASSEPKVTITTSTGITGTGTSRMVMHDGSGSGATANSVIVDNGNSTNVPILATGASTNPVGIYFGTGNTPTYSDCHVKFTPNGTYGNLETWASQGSITVSGNPSTVFLSFKRIRRNDPNSASSGTIIDTWQVDIPTFRGLAGNAFNSEKIITPTGASLSYFSDTIPTSQMVYCPIIFGYSTDGVFSNISDKRSGSMGIGRNSSGDFVVVFRYNGSQYAFGTGYIHVYPTSVVVNALL
uniref:Uncharacterized protein n=1 Tax=Clandestinovirus TaxID=2831644 RepID=A0A8F8KQS6_9VIRU|nr:hypothetical protein KOM_12_200 [Clandestinovirus]